MPKCTFLLWIGVVAGCGREAAPTPSPPAPAPTPVVLAADAAPALPTIDWARHGLADRDCFLIRDLATGAEQVNDAARCDLPRRPYSTFKIPTALAALDLGILDGPDAMMRWDATTYPPEPHWPDAWKGDHTLREAIEVSAVPLFRALAIQIGAARMQAHLDKLGYGNRDMSGGSDKFWLSGGIRISARQQVDFLARLIRDELPVAKPAQATVREILDHNRDRPVRFRGKTGTGPNDDVGDGRAAGMVVWQVGWIELAGRPVVFAMWIDGAQDVPTLRAHRVKVVDAVLTELTGGRT